MYLKGKRFPDNSGTIRDNSGTIQKNIGDPYSEQGIKMKIALDLFVAISITFGKKDFFEKMSPSQKRAASQK